MNKEKTTMAEQEKQQLTTESESIKQKSEQLDKLERESDEERPGNEGLHGLGMEDEGDPDHYGPQDQFGDIDGQDPYSNLDNPESTTPEGEDPDDVEHGLYGLAEPLAREGDISRQGSDKDRYGTRRSQDQQGYQQ